ncbi:hypothetical protein EDD18DRAFT_1203662, partial [Armillaria luteobubalina]
KPTGQNQVAMDALADNNVHHPVVWKTLLDRYVDKETFFRSLWDIFTIEMCLNLVTSIYLPEDRPHESCGCTLADILVTCHKQKILTGLLAFFSTFESDNDAIDVERRLLLAILHALAPDSAQLAVHSGQHYPFGHDYTISKYRLLRAALRAIDKNIHYHPDDLPSAKWRTDVFQAILSYMKSDVFTGCSLSHSEGSVWTCRSHALMCMASLMRGGPEYSTVELNAEWVTKPLILNILPVIHDDSVADTPSLSAIPDIPDPPQCFEPTIGAAGSILGQAFSREIPRAYEAFREEKGLGDIAVKISPHPELIELLLGYFTGLSKTKARNVSAIQSDDFLDWHIQDLHQVHVIGFVCACITYGDTPRHRILSSLVSVDPNHSEWDVIVKTLSNSDEFSFGKYIPRRKTFSDDHEYLKKSMKVTVRMLAQFNRLSKIFNYHTGLAETRRESRLRKGKKRVQDPEGGH